MRKYILFLLVLSSKTIVCQHIGLTDIYPIVKLGYNPSVASHDQKAHFTVIGQYGKIDEIGGTRNYYISAEMPILKSLGLAAQFSDFSNKIIKHNCIAIDFAKHIKLSEKASLSVGFITGMVNTNFDYDSDYWLSILQESTNIKSTNPSTSKSQLFSRTDNKVQQYLLGTGLYFNTELWHIGLAIPNIIKNKFNNMLDPNAKVQFERPAFLSVERDFQLTEKFKLRTGSLYRFSKNQDQQGLDLQSSIWMNSKFGLGVWGQRIGAKTANPILLTAEVKLKNTSLAYNFNLINSSNYYSNIKQQIMFRIDVDYIKKKPTI